MELNSFNTLVLSGAGVNGFITLGSLQYLWDKFMIQDIDVFIGTSIGSIISYLIAIGYTPIELLCTVCTSSATEKLKFIDLFSFTQGSGAISYTPIQEFLEKLTIDKIGKFLTLQSLYEKYKKRLVCVTYNLTDKKTEYLTPETHPDIPCLTAIRMSSCVPLLFDKFKYDGKYYIDGGITNNFPIDFAQTYFNEWITDKIPVTLGICIQNLPTVDDTNVVMYVYRLVNIPINKITQLNIQQNKDNHNIKIICIKPNKKIESFELSVSIQDKLNLFSRGYQKTKKIIHASHTASSHNFDA